MPRVILYKRFVELAIQFPNNKGRHAWIHMVTDLNDKIGTSYAIISVLGVKDGILIRGFGGPLS